MTDFLGADPGASGAMAIIDSDGCVISFIKNDSTQRDIWDWIRGRDIRFGALEYVSAMPKQGVSSTFKFGTSFGFCQGMLVAGGVPFELVTPKTWQTAMRCKSGGDKNVTKRKAQELFPNTKITHANADALLLAEYARRLSLGLLTTG